MWYYKKIVNSLVPMDESTAQARTQENSATAKCLEYGLPIRMSKLVGYSEVTRVGARTQQLPYGVQAWKDCATFLQYGIPVFKLDPEKVPTITRSQQAGKSCLSAIPVATTSRSV